MKKPSLINKLFLFLNYLAVACLLISYLSPYISPEIFWPIAFFGLAYPLLLGVNILFVIFWCLKWKRQFLLSIVVIAIGWTHLSGFIQISATGKKDNSTGFKILSYNVRLFDLYNWKNDKNIVTRNKIFDFIKEDSADVICLQEFFSDDSGHFATIDTIVKFQKAINHHVEYTESMYDKFHWGIATFSKYPIIDRGKVEFEEKSNNICIYTDLKVEGDTIRVYNTHMASIHFQYKDYQLLSNIGKVNPGYTPKAKDIVKEDLYEGSKNILRLMKSAFVKRAKQADIISKHIAKSPHSVIICGDFNDTPASYAYHKIAGELSDAFVQSGKGFGRTYIGAFPSFRIDYILHSKKLRSSDFQTITQKELSDHYPISCYIEIVNK